MPSRAGRGSRPVGPFQVNRDSWQANYVRWFVQTRGTLHDIGRGVASPFTILGSPTSALFAPVGDMGVVARTEHGTGIDRAWTVALPGPLDGLTALTIAYWVYPIDLAGHGVSSWWGQGAGNSCFCETNSGSTTGPYWRGGTDHRNAFTEVATAGARQHLAWTADASNTHYYRNGVLRQTVAGGCGTIAAADVAFYIGGQPSGSGAATMAVDAYWEDFRVYPFRALDHQIAELADPETSWDLCWVPGRRVFFDVVAASGFVPFPHPRGLTGGAHVLTGGMQ